MNFDDAALIPASTEGDEEAKVEDDKLGTKPSSEAYVGTTHIWTKRRTFRG